MKILNTLLGCFILIALLSGCSARSINEPFQNTTAVGDKQESPDFVLVNPFTDDPDNLSPHNPFIKKFGNISEVRTYIRLKQKFLYGIGLNVDEVIDLYTAEALLYPSFEAEARLKAWKKDKERYERLGIPMGEPVFTYRNADANGEEAAVNEEVD